ADLDPQNVYALSSFGVVASSVPEIALRADVVFLSLPSINEVEQVCSGQGLIAQAGSVKTIVDMSTSDVERTRKLAARLAEQRIELVDASAACRGAACKSETCLSHFGGGQRLFDAVKPFRSCMDCDVLLCGPTGAGQVVKSMNNMVLINSVH